MNILASVSTTVPSNIPQVTSWDWWKFFTVMSPVLAVFVSYITAFSWKKHETYKNDLAIKKTRMDKIINREIDSYETLYQSLMEILQEFTNFGRFISDVPKYNISKMMSEKEFHDFVQERLSSFRIAQKKLADSAAGEGMYIEKSLRFEVDTVLVPAREMIDKSSKTHIFVTKSSYELTEQDIDSIQQDIKKGIDATHVLINKVGNYFKTM